MGSSPGWSFGFVPTPAQWNKAFSDKQDQLSYTALNKGGDTMLGPLITTASIAGAAGFNVPAGVAPTTPNNGDVWNTGTNVFIELNGLPAAFNTYSGATLQATPPGPAGTTSGTGVMMGIGTGVSITPTLSSRIEISVQGYATLSGTGTFTIGLYNGTGVAPSNGSGIVGTRVGTTILETITQAGGKVAFLLTGIVTGLVSNTPVWIDLSLATTAGTASIPGVSITAREV